MFISDFAIKRPIVTIVTMVALLIFGTFSLLTTDVDEFPQISMPVVFVAIPYPGASPDQVEREVVDRIEEQIGAISGLDKMNSTSLDGYATIIVQFKFGKDPAEAAQDIRDAISAVRADLPVEMKEPIIRKFDPNDLPVVSLTLSSKVMGPNELSILADPGITKQLRAIPGVAQVNVVGNVDREISVDVQPDRMQAAGVSVAQVVSAIQAQNLAAPVGRINSAMDERSIRLKGRLDDPEQFLNLVVAQRNGHIIRLGDVATVHDSNAEQRTLALFNGVEAVGIDIVKSKDVSTTRVADDIKAQLDVIQKNLPPGVTIDIVKDAGERVRSSVRNVEETLVEGALLTVLVVFLFLNSWRSTVITGLALPVSTISAFIAVKAFGFTLNTMSLLGLSLAIGILIDDAIVVRENIVRHVEMGEDHFKAAHTGTDEIGLAVAATTFSIVCVFAPIAFMGGISGQWFKPFALTIACAVLVSLFVSFSLDPMLSAYWPDPEIEAGEHRNWISRQLDRFNHWFDTQADRYKGLIAWALDHRLAMVSIAAGAFVAALTVPVGGLLAALVVLLAVVALVIIEDSERLNKPVKIVGALVTVVLMVVLVKAVPTVGKLGGEFAPQSDNSELNIAIETPPGSNLDYGHIKAEEVGRIVRAHKEVAYTYTTIGSTLGTGAVDEGNIYVRLVPKSERSIHQNELGAIIRDEIARLGGVTAYTFTGGFGGNQKQIQIEVRGDDETAMNRVAMQMQAAIRGVKGAADVGLSTKGLKPELEVQLNRGLAGALGLTVGQVAQSLRPAFAGIKAGDWVDPTGKTRDVTVRLEPEARERPADLHNLPLTLPSADGSTVTLPLGQVATITQGTGPAQIDHLDRDKVIVVGANAQGRPLSEVSADVNAIIKNIVLPPHVTISQGGEVKDQQEVFGAVFAALGLAILLMYLILVVQFGSFLDPLAILSSLPLSLIGVVLALVVTNGTLNIMSLIGVILLMGIVAKNAILLVDFAKWQKHDNGLSMRDALIYAGRVRLRPIMMTTLALIAGMIPVSLGLGEGADFRAPLGRAVIGGVITSTLLTLLVIPTVYEILDEWREKFVARFRRTAPEAAGHGAAGAAAGAPTPVLGKPTV
jgi:HAE1 family hydrophobic/amphiphilic exporter-1